MTEKLTKLNNLLEKVDDDINMMYEKLNYTDEYFRSGFINITNKWEEFSKNVNVIKCSIESKKISIINVDCKKDAYIKKHKHVDEDETIFVIEGKLKYIEEGKEYSSGDVIKINKNTFHSFKILEDTKLTVTFNPPLSKYE